MPVFQEAANSARDLRILPSRALPLPRITPTSDGTADAVDHHEVVVIGAGPSGLFLTLMLARYGITGSSLVCLDSKPGTLKAGQADGLQPRTLEVFQSLDIASELISEGCHMEEITFWNPIAHDSQTDGDAHYKGGIERTAIVPDVSIAARYDFEVTIHQGRIERVLQENLNLYAPPDIIRRSHRFTEYSIDTENHRDYPVLVKYEYDNEDGTVSHGTMRTKYLIGADGAHSKVRKCMGYELEGETSDHIWGVCDFVAESDFPDIRKRCAVHSAAGSVMVIPRERIATGDFLTRLYVQVPGEVDPDVENTVECTPDGKRASKKRRGEVTLDYITEQASAVFAPYKIAVKKGTEPDWRAAYQIGQRMTNKYSKRAPDGLDRVFIVGDACHTHSPKAGQGMNVSMMDSYNLSWKLAHSINGLTPSRTAGTADLVLETFEQERAATARRLIDFDTKFSHMFSGKIGAGDATSMEGLTHEQFLKVFTEGNGFTSGCGLHYEPSPIVRPSPDSATRDAMKGHPVPGTRLLNVELKRHADGTTRQLHDELGSSGRYRLLVLTSTDLLSTSSTSCSTLEACANTLTRFPTGTIDFVVLHPLAQQSLEWTAFPACVKRMAEMSTYGPAKREDAYEIYAIEKAAGALVIVRPDGYVGFVGSLDETAEVEEFLKGCLIQV